MLGTAGLNAELKFPPHGHDRLLIYLFLLFLGFCCDYDPLVQPEVLGDTGWESKGGPPQVCLRASGASWECSILRHNGLAQVQREAREWEGL